MKTKIKLLTTLIVLASSLFSLNKVSAQAALNSAVVPTPAPNHDILYSPTAHVITIMGGTYSHGTAVLNACGINTETPQFKLDVKGDADTDDINISCPTCSPVNSGGYRIGGNMVLWHNGITSNIYLGINAGNASSTGIYNTFLGAGTGNSTTSGQGNVAVGYYALNNNSGSNPNAPDFNTAVGYSTMQNNTTGGVNTACGSNALYTNSTGNYNTAIGGSALFHNTVDYNTACGYYALYTNSTGTGNTATGSWALNFNTGGSNNTANGYGALRYNTSGVNNTSLGYGALLNNTTGTLNTALGVVALYNNGALSGSVAIGDSALYNQSSTSPSNIGNVAVGNSALYGSAGGGFNTAVGQWAMRYGGGGSCVAVGFGSLYSMKYGGNNTAAGYESMYSLIGGVENTAFGYQALYSEVGSADNVAVGEYALYSNLASYNTAVGDAALQGNTTGTSNTAIGGNSLGGITGSSNSAIGMWAGMNNDGSRNTFLGDSAGAYNTTGQYNTYVGYQAGDGTGFSTVSNTTCLGDMAGFSASTVASNCIYLGNNAITNIYAVPLGFSAYSDRRIKDSIKANVPGLAFINKLQPVTYNLDIHKEASLMNVQDTINWPGKYNVEKIKQSGFIAQAVDSAAQACGYNFSGLGKPQTPNGLYTLGYTTFVVPLVKAVQELSAKNDTVRSAVDSLRSLRTTVDSLRSALKNIQNCLSQLCGTTGNGHTPGQHGAGNTNQGDTNSSGNVQDVTLSGLADAPLLYQNMPNPFNTGTKINYYLPQGTMGATIAFFDTYGNQIKTVQLSQSGNGTLNITPDNLSNGIYSYSLIVNGSLVDTKRMVLQK